MAAKGDITAVVDRPVHSHVERTAARRRITRPYHAGDIATLVGQKESHPQSYLAWWRGRINIAPRHDARKNNIPPGVDGGSKEKGIAMSPPSFTPRRPNSLGPKTPPPGAGWPERIICVSCPRSPTNTPSPPVVTSAVKPTSPRLLMALGSKSKVKLPPPGAGLSRNAIGVKLYPASPAKATGTRTSVSATTAAIFFIVIFFVFIFC